MKKDIHPKEYRYVVFRDRSSDQMFLTRSTARTTDTITWEDGNEYPLVNLEISAYSHPFFTGKQRYVDSAGRVERFQRKFAGSYFNRPGEGGAAAQPAGDAADATGEKKTTKKKDKDKKKKKKK